MTLNQLRTFLVLAETGSVRASAEKLFVSQPAVSGTLAALQRELGVELVSRDGRGLKITEAGFVFAGYARRILGLLDEARAGIAGQENPGRGTVRLAGVTTAGEHLLPAMLASFRSSYPQAQVVLEVGNRSRVWDLLDHHEVDLVVGGRPPPGANLRSLATRSNQLVLVARAGARSASDRLIGPDELAREVWLLREPGSGTRATVEEFFQSIGISPPTLTLGSNGAIRESTRVGLGITLISRDAVARELDEGSLEQWRSPGLPLERAWHLAAREGEDLAPTTQLFLDHMVDDGSAGRFKWERVAT